MITTSPSADYILLSDESSDDCLSPYADADETPLPFYLLPYRKFEEMRDSVKYSGVLYEVCPATSGPLRSVKSLLNSDIYLVVKKAPEEDYETFARNDAACEAGVCGRDREFTLIPAVMWLGMVSKRHASFSVGEGGTLNSYPLKLVVSALRDVNSLGVKISKRDNTLELFERACKIFSNDFELMHVWDFSGRIRSIIDGMQSLPKDFQWKTDLHTVLELQIYGLSDSPKHREEKREEVSQSKGFASDASVMMNARSSSGHNFPRVRFGLRGLTNLGYTCFMNSAIQCLAHSPRLVAYFLGYFRPEVNFHNKDSSKGKVAVSFGDLVRKLWARGESPLEPRNLKSTIDCISSDFRGYDQHDSQEFLLFLLEKLHEDLNRVMCKPNTKVKDGEDGPDGGLADEFWKDYLAQNDSIIVDLFAGQEKSTLVCCLCGKASITYSPFKHLSLSLSPPSTRIPKMKMTVMKCYATSKPSLETISVRRYEKAGDLIWASSHACSLAVNERLLVAQIHNHRIMRFLENPADLVPTFSDGDHLVAYCLPDNAENMILIVFVHQQMEQKEEEIFSWKESGVPLVGAINGEAVKGSDIRNLYLQLLSPIITPKEHDIDGQEISQSQNLATEGTKEAKNVITTFPTPELNLVEANRIDLASCMEFEFDLTDEKGNTKMHKLPMDECVMLKKSATRLHVNVRWPEKYNYILDNAFHTIVSEDLKSGFGKQPEPLTLYECFEAYLEEEHLICDCDCKHNEAIRKMDLSRLPEILVIHFKRFSVCGQTVKKLETFVKFPVNLNLASYVTNGDTQQSPCYMLYAVTNHYGSGLNTGHYTAFVHDGRRGWYEFADNVVRPMAEKDIKTPAAYILFYKRVADPW